MAHDTIAYYNRNADLYFERTVNLNNRAAVDLLIGRMRAGASILDAGCGSGRDAKSMLDQGFDVTAFDASHALASRAAAHIQRDVLTMAFAEVPYLLLFDGVLANASLLHLDRAALVDAIDRLYQSLKGGGVMLATFKSRATEVEDRTGRFFAYWSDEELVAFFTRAGFSKVHVHVLPDLFGRDADWYAVEAHKA